jgi:TetR/AcrR family transcriptional regulator
MVKTETDIKNVSLSRREREKIKRRNDMIDAAQNRFFGKGFDSVSMEEIARDLELSKPALYLYFKNKESLFLAVVLRGMVILQKTLTHAMAKQKSGLEKVQGFLEALCFEYVPKHQEYYKLLVVAREQHFMDMFEKHEIEGSEQFGNMAIELLTLVVEAIELGKEDGTIRENVEPLQTAIFLSVASEAAVQMTSEYKKLLTHRGLTMNDYLKHSTDLMLQGISTKS